ncbi:MAG: hypothetical protein JNJ60_04760 [Rhodocyclaceae bacterium]|nr:hypothetical protein [Rhodocyclaceae bacterium]
MSAESAFLAAVADLLANHTQLVPAPASIGPAEPAQNTDLPAVVLSLEQVARLGAGLGERSALITDGALPVRATIDLANPVLPGEPGFVLLSADRRTLILPHGGLRQADGGEGPLGPADLSVSVAGAAQTVVNAPPGAGQVRADALIGQLLFGAPLPATGNVVANYVLGQWERRVTEIAGTLCVVVRDAGADSVASLSDGVLDALMAAPRNSLPGLRKIALSDLSSISVRDTALANSRARTARFSFDFEHELNMPESSGGVIARIPITTRLTVVTVDPASGAVAATIVTEG